MLPPVRTIVWQPLAEYSRLDKATWERLGNDVQIAGYSQVLVQWSRYGDYQFFPQGPRNWLPAGLQYLQEKHLRLILGLYLGRDYFQVLQQSDEALHAYLVESQARSLAQAEAALRKPLALDIDGWYLPEEIDDLNWRSDVRQRMLSAHLVSMREALARLTPGAPEKPVYISTFFSGASSPQNFAQMLERLHRDTRVIWIVQDGMGTHRLPDERTKAYLSAISRTLPPTGWRGLLEAFDESRVDDQAPRFEPASPEVIAHRMALWCASTGRQPAVTFSLNELMKGILFKSAR